MPVYGDIEAMSVYTSERQVDETVVTILLDLPRCRPSSDSLPLQTAAVFSHSSAVRQTPLPAASIRGLKRVAPDVGGAWPRSVHWR